MMAADDSGLIEATDVLKAIFALMLEEREERAEKSKTTRRAELVLSDVGLNRQQIAQLLNKSPDAVRKVLSRAS